MKKEAEPTLNDVIEIMQEGFSRIETRLDSIETRINAHGDRFDLIDARIDQRFGLLNERLNLMDERLKALGLDVSKTTKLVLDVQDEIVSHNVAFEHEANRYFDHERRIAVLEHAVV